MAHAAHAGFSDIIMKLPNTRKGWKPKYQGFIAALSNLRFHHFFFGRLVLGGVNAVVVDGVDDVGHRVDGDEQEGEQ